MSGKNHKEAYVQPVVEGDQYQFTVKPLEAQRLGLESMGTRAVLKSIPHISARVVVTPPDASYTLWTRHQHARGLRTEQAAMMTA